MGSYMDHLNYFHTRVAGVNFCLFIALPSGGGRWYYAKCEMQDAAMQNRWQNKHAKIMDIARNCEMSTVATDASWLMATVVAMDSRRHFSKR